MKGRTIPWWLYWSAVALLALYVIFSPLLVGVLYGIVSRTVILAMFLFLFTNPSERMKKEDEVKE